MTTVLDCRTSGKENWLTREWAEVRAARVLTKGPLRLPGDQHDANCRSPKNYCTCSAEAPISTKETN